jgi:cobalamin biosynthesis Mg chelatase CobN
MRTRVSLLAAVLVAGLWAANALAKSPAQIYSDYVSTGHLSCSYSRGELERVLRSGTINQYGDPLTLARLKLAARRHLAGSCNAVPRGSASAVSGPTTSSSSKPSGSSKGKPRSKGKQAQAEKRSQRAAAGLKASASGGNGSFFAGRVLIVGLLALALAFGGWLTKRGLSARD